MAGPTQLFDRESGKWVEVPDHEITPAIQSGKYAFAQGIDIPIVTADGQLGYVPSDKAEEAFTQYGARWQTPADVEADTRKQLEASKEKNFGDTQLIAGTLGLARGATAGLSDVALNALGVKEGVKAVKELNPVTSAVGEVAGTVAPGGLASKVGGALAKLPGEVMEATNVARAIKGGEELSKAGQIIQRYAAPTLGSAAEGAFYGVGQGISETALGDPSELAQNLAAGAGYGSLFGGLFGAGFQGAADAAPVIKNIAKASLETTSDLASKAARKGYEKVVVPVIKARHGDEIADSFRYLVSNPETREPALHMGPEKYAEAVRIAQKAEDALQKEARDLRADLNFHIKDYPAQEKRAIEEAMASSKGDLNKALKDLYDQRVEAHTNFDNSLLALSTVPAEVAPRLISDTQSLVNKLQNSGSQKSMALGNSLDAILKSEMKPNMSVMDEVNLAKRLRQEVPVAATGLGSFDKTARKSLIDFRTAIDDYALKNHPNELVSTYQPLLDAQDQAYFNLSQFVGSKRDPGSKLYSVMKDPEKAAKLDVLLNNASQFAPAFSELKDGFKSIAEKQNFLKEVANKANELKSNAVVGKFSTSDMDELLSMIKPGKDIENRLDRLKQIETSLQATPEATTLDKYISVQKALGNPVDKTIEELAKAEPAFKALDKLKAVSKESNNNLLGWGALGYFISPKIALALRGAESVLNAGLNPYKSVRTLNSIEKMANKAANTVNKAIEGSVEAVLNPATKRVAVAAAPKLGSRKEQMETYEKQKAVLSQMADPQAASDYLSTRFGTMPGAPNTQSAMMAHALQIAQFLNSKLPQPVIDQDVFGKTAPISELELSKFSRYVRATQDPLTVFDSIKRGDVSSEEVETLKTLYPSMYKQLQDRVINGIKEYSKEPSYQQKLMMANLLDLPIDVTMRPDFIASMQQTYMKQEQDKGGRPEGKSIKIDLKHLDQLQTPATRITNK